MKDFAIQFEALQARGGPLPAEYSSLQKAIQNLADATRAGSVAAEEVSAWVRVASQGMAGTMQAEALEQRYGYSGDFQIIDHIYTRQVCADPHLRNWDLFFHAQAAPVAVRNRKAYFQALLHELLACRISSTPLSVLNVASGPARDLREFFQNAPEAPLFVDCVDMDAHAIAHAQHLCRPWLDRLRFHHRNVLRFVPNGGYDLAWSAGLFDYLNERAFVHLLTALLAVTKSGGQVVIGNFSDHNPSRDYMELLGNWHLHHRSREALLTLAGRAGVSPDRVQILWEPEGVNYFLHVQK